MKPGIPQGFVRFGSTSHRILTYLHEHGPATGAELARVPTHCEAVQVSATIIRLRKAGMIFVVGRHRPSGKRSHPLFGLEPVARPIGPRVMTLSEKQRAYLQRRKLKVPSVFEFRGAISIK